MKLWPHQERMLNAIKSSTEQRLLVTAPTGAGKSRVMIELIRYWTALGKRVMLMTHRQMLRDQLIRVMEENHIKASLMASGFEFDPYAQCYVAMDRTIESWVFRNERIEFPSIDVVIPDEAHLMDANVHREVFELVTRDGGRVVGFTATPVGLGGTYNELLIGATNSECRRCGSHVPATHFIGAAGDIRDLKPLPMGIYKDGDTVRRIMQPVVNGDVMAHWREHNPNELPTILFAPSVASSLWVAEHFSKQGVNTAHIDAKDIWLNGETIPSTHENRLAVMEASKSGHVKIVTNRFVMREGLDWPWLSVLSICTCFGSLSSYLQAGGRVLRSAPGKSQAIVLDHGNHDARFGSLNMDREWELSKCDSDYKPDWQPNDVGERKEPEPIVCPKCSAARRAMLDGVIQRKCHVCGHESTKSIRPIRQTNGKLRLAEGDYFSTRKPRPKPEDEANWKSIYFRCKRAKKPMTFNQARGLFYREHGRWPETNLPMMPIHESNWSSRINDVPSSDLHGVPYDTN